MTKASSFARKLAANPWFMNLAAISSIVSLGWLLVDIFYAKPPLLSGIIFFLAISIFLMVVLYSYRIRIENIALKDVAATFNEINHIYRDSLKDMFSGDDPTVNPEDLLQEEERVLRSVCQRVQNIFDRLINRTCMVTIKLVLVEEDKKCYAHTYVRSLENCARDKPERKKYQVATGVNTAFDKALLKRPDGVPSHFFSPDLTNEKVYSNERQHYDKLYRSVIVVPIRGVNKGNEDTIDEYDMIGFLCVDTKSTHRFNDGYHLQIVSSLAGQMYNYMSLMRGNYTVFVG